MANTIKHKRSTTQGSVPSTSALELGEIAINTYDGVIFIKRDNGTPSVVAIGGAVGVTDGDKGDITVSNAGLTWVVDSGAITYAKIQNVSATDKILGRLSAGAGTIEEITCTAAGRALIDDADAAAQRTTLGLGTLATQSGTFSGTSSGINTGDQTITLTGDVTGSGTGSFATTLANTIAGNKTFSGALTTVSGTFVAANAGNTAFFGPSENIVVYGADGTLSFKENAIISIGSGKDNRTIQLRAETGYPSGTEQSAGSFITLRAADTDRSIEFRSNNSVRMLMAHNGGISINSGTAPDAQLHVTTGSASTKGLIVKGSASQSSNLFEAQNSSGTALCVVNASGNVGIGTNAPLDMLDVSSASGSFRARFRNTTANEAFALFQNTNTGTTTTDGLAIGINASAVAYLWNHENSDFIIGNNNGERLRITSSGNVGIGTASPGTKLDVSGSIRSSSQLISTVATGTAPLSVSSTTLVTNLNADLLDGLSATSANTGSTVVSRDSSGNFSAGTITANLTGLASGATTATYLNTAASSSTADNITTRINSGFWETSTATTAEGWPETTNGWYHLLASTHSNAGNYFSMQFAANFSDNNALYYRVTDGNGSKAWKSIWHSGNLNPTSSNIANTVVARDGSGNFSISNIYAGRFYANDWFRAQGNAGFYFENWGGGWYMTDGSYVKTYNNKAVEITGRGIKYTGTTIGGGTSNDIAFKWSSPNIIGVIDNAVAVSIANTSDHRLKEQFTNLDPAESLLKIQQLRPGQYFPKDFDGSIFWDRPQVGLIAHEVSEVIPMVVMGEKDAVSDQGTNVYQSVNYSGIIPVLISAVQELINKIEELEARLPQN